MNEVLDAVIQRWQIQAEPDPLMLALLAAAVVVVTGVPAVWRVTRQAATIIHEMGHVLVAWLVGRRVSGIKLHSDTSGVTVSKGRPDGPGLLLTFLAGYPAPGVLAVLLVWLASAGHAGAALTVFQAVLMLALLLSRNAVGIFSCLLAAAAAGAVWWWNDPDVVVYTVVGLGAFYAAAGVRGSFDVTRVHIQGIGRGHDPRRRAQVAGTDAAQAARAWRLLPLPAALWLVFFHMLSAACAAAVVWMLWP
ncbi:M50 family metallopeptidase [Nesterenkonia flava]|uniref:M50 family metallopeptidase n=1 Tax=Nesterenkonia flava TaxID=469799 RepID=A0ABU1FRD0_9MICC|nr:M50 family metallopeptidase [Nesterenkonia flava]MDR5710882.1 M50 family metallopeptidase [Nesterenkonia flava]